ncbi:MAG: tetratricopeptide repeat protein [Limnothrix sp.]
MIPPELYRNQQTYQQLAQVLSLGLRRQIWIAVCDNRYWRDRLMDRLAEQHPATTTAPNGLIPIVLDEQNPELNPLLAISHWLKDNQQHVNPLEPSTFAITGIEHLTLQSSSQQRRFLKNLKFIADAYVPKMDFNLLLWLPRPWMNSIAESVPEFWQWRTGLFEFQGEPTPVRLADLPKPEQFFPIQDQQFFDRYFRALDPQNLHSAVGVDSEQQAWDLSQKYRDQIHQDQTDATTLSLALESYEQLLEYIEPGDRRLGDLYNDMGNFTWLTARQLSEPDQKQRHLQRSVDYYQQALAAIATPRDEELYAMIQNNLGAVYNDLAHYQKSTAPLHQAVAAYEAALQYRSPETDTLRYISTQNNLGTVYWHLAQQENSVNHLQGAISCYEAALALLDQDQEPDNWAMMQNNLGTAYLNLSQYQDPKACLQVASVAYQAALQYRTPDTNPLGCASTHNNLGTTYWQCSVYFTEDSDRWQATLEAAIASYEVTLSLTHLLTQDNPKLVLDFAVLETLNNLGLIHYQLATELTSTLASPDKIEHLHTAIKAHSLSLGKQTESETTYEDTLSYLIGEVRAIYEQGGIIAQNQAISEVPSHFLPKILARL